MSGSWSIIATAASLAILLLLILRWHWHAFAALLVVSIGLGIVAGMPPEAAVRSVSKGVGEMLAGVTLLLALGAILGRVLDRSGAALVVASRLVDAAGIERAPLGVLVASYILGISVFYNVGFLLLIPILYRLHETTLRSLLFYLLPMSFSLSLTHSLVPPHPGIVATVQAFGGTQASQVMIETIVGGTLLGVPMAVVGWFGPGRAWARKQMLGPPARLATTSPKSAQQADAASAKKPGLTLSLAVILLPLLLCVLGFGAGLLGDLKRLPDSLTTPWIQKEQLPTFLWLAAHRPVDWLLFLGNPTIALGLAVVVGMFVFGRSQGWTRLDCNKLVSDGLQDVGSMIFLFGAAGGFKQVIQDSGAGVAIANLFASLPLSPVLMAFVTAVAVRAALGSATAAHATTSALLAEMAFRSGCRASVLVLAVSAGVTFLTPPADSGFWLLKEYGNLSVRDILVRYNYCRGVMALVGLGILLICERWLTT
jgi:gluconate transporter